MNLLPLRLLPLLALLISCGNIGFFGASRGRDEKSTADSKEEQKLGTEAKTDEEDDTADEPVQVSGAFLCGTPDDFQATETGHYPIGCAIRKDGKKVAEDDRTFQLFLFDGEKKVAMKTSLAPVTSSWHIFAEIPDDYKTKGRLTLLLVSADQSKEVFKIDAPFIDKQVLDSTRYPSLSLTYHGQATVLGKSTTWIVDPSQFCDANGELAKQIVSGVIFTADVQDLKEGATISSTDKSCFDKTSLGGTSRPIVFADNTGDPKCFVININAGNDSRFIIISKKRSATPELLTLERMHNYYVPSLCNIGACGICNDFLQ